MDTVIRYSVWDDWELIEEYGTTRAAAYLQGAHGVIKSLMNNVYYYQDSLGSTTHIANATGQLLESFRYDLYGTPNIASAYGVTDLYAGERWIPELGLYDLRNRFMSPDLGRFLQADPIGFKGDGSNLYRYCGNDPVDRSDPTGLIDFNQPNLTSFGQGDWMRAGSPFTNGEMLGKVKDYVASITNTVNNAVKNANAASRNVKWSASFSNSLKSPEYFKNPRSIATTAWSAKSAIVMNAGTVASFNVNLQININWNANQSAYFGSALRTDNMGWKTGEIEHARDAARALTSSYGGARPAVDIANEQAASMVGRYMGEEWASSRMDFALSEWERRTMAQSQFDRDISSMEHKY
jgi:RHS repeat-associated protein